MIDVVAGFALATAAAVVAPRVTRWELARRQAQGLSVRVPLFGAGKLGRAPDQVERATA